MTAVINKHYARPGLFLCVLLLAACASVPENPPEPVELPDQFSASGSANPELPDAWWTAFDDGELNQLVETALNGNLSLRASYQRLLQARALADRQGAGLLPSLDATASAETRESDTAQTDSFSAGLNASYELDLWGRVQSLTEAEELRAAASQADYQAAAVSLSGEIASTWFQLVEQRAQLALARSQLETNQNVLTVIESRFSMGQSGSADVLRQRQLVSASTERLINIQGEISVLQNQLAVLLGQSPGKANLPDEQSLPALPPLPDTGVPAELVQRRPDLQQAWRVVQAADQDLAAAISNRFPRISIEASVSSQANDASDLFDNWLATLAGNLLVPLIDGGERRADVRRSEAVLEALIQEYGQSVLTAIREVEDALAREQQQKQRLASLEQRIGYADTAYRQLRNQYLNGAVSYIEVLNALQEKQDLQRNILNTRQQLLTTRVALYRALAGRIEDSQDKDRKESNEA
ncbi:efflux transporter outer membrane subunit [Marinobacter confluentis]|uniref:Efflux transporter outer membrane subunit n=1 Tax=Marinobacter confluentis TaxID=1697557 RepID=A0A4Z1BHY7_9GAMM|nr:efflux transporter outer membrane subunit [Marinobacter confluentis]TGN39179.1 efflux transporter outer membrane subunit [Marinobacter confluentis]